MKLDLLDRKILFELEQNSKIPLTKLSKAVRASREVVNYRIKRLEEEKVIKSYITRLNQSFFCSGAATLNVKIKRNSNEKYVDFLEFLENHSSVNWFGEICGIYDLTITILYLNPKNLGEIVENILKYLKEDLIKHSISLYTQEIEFSRAQVLDIEKNNFELKEGSIFEKNYNQIKLDEKDIIILSELSKNSKIKNIELAQKINLGEDIIRIRIKNLENKKIILGYTIVIDVTKFNLEGYYISIQLENYNSKEVIKYLHSNKNIYFATFMAGTYNLLLGVYSKNRIHFNEILLDLREQLGNSIKDYTFEMLLKEHKEVFLTQKMIESLRDN